MRPPLTAKKLAARTAVFITLLTVVMCLCSLVGSQRISLKKIFQGPAAVAEENIDYEIFIGVRVPRVILAGLIGAALGCCGAVLQAILRNPLAEPYILGISSGAGFGAIIAIILGATYGLLGGSAITVFAFAGAIAAVLAVWAISHFTARSQPTTLLLAGVVVNAFLSAVIMFISSMAGGGRLFSTMLWLMGDIKEQSFLLLGAAAAVIFGGIAVLFGISGSLNALSLGDEQAKSLGVNAAAIRLIGLGVTAFITAVAVSLGGLIGFAGLIVPHGVRLALGPDHRQLIPLSAIMGAMFLVVADTLARTIIAPAQLPVGVITAIAGGPFFLVLLARYTRKAR